MDVIVHTEAMTAEQRKSLAYTLARLTEDPVPVYPTRVHRNEKRRITHDASK
jgi:hypothetical protein